MNHIFCKMCGLSFLASGFENHRRKHFRKFKAGHAFEALPKFSILKHSNCQHCGLPEDVHQIKKPGSLDVTGLTSD